MLFLSYNILGRSLLFIRVLIIMGVSILLAILAGVIAYLLGSINFAIILSKIFVKTDIREHGSGNAGMTNVVRTAGKLPGILTLAGDIIKGGAAVAIGRYLIFPYIYNSTPELLFLPIYGAFFCGICCMLGHIFPLYFAFRGGKGVATAVGIIGFIDWRVLIIALSIFAVLFLITKIVSVGSIIAAASLPVSTFFLFPLAGAVNVGLSKRWIETLLMCVLAAIMIIKHRKNIVRIFKGEEKPLISKKD